MVATLGVFLLSSPTPPARTPQTPPQQGTTRALGATSGRPAAGSAVAAPAFRPPDLGAWRAMPAAPPGRSRRRPGSGSDRGRRSRARAAARSPAAAKNSSTSRLIAEPERGAASGDPGEVGGGDGPLRGRGPGRERRDDLLLLRRSASSSSRQLAGDQREGDVELVGLEQQSHESAAVPSRRPTSIPGRPG